MAHSAYVDPRVVDHFENGTVVESGREKDVRDLLRHPALLAID